MPLKQLAENDELGNAAAHFFKSGNVIRGDENNALAELRPLLPSNGPKGTRVEYDIWYDMGDNKNIHGYTYTDAMAKFIYLRTASCHFSNKIMREAAQGEITPEGEAIFQDLGSSSVDKYRLRKAKEHYDFVVFLPGTNIIDKALDWDKLKNAVKQGAKLKCHPLTAPALVAKLKHTFGEGNVIDKKVSGHQLLSAASIVGCCENSEMGLVALAQGKTTYMFGTGEGHFTYSSIYKAVWQNGKASVNNFKAILSSKSSGLVPILSESPQEYVDGFFNYYKDMPHVSPRNTNS